MPHQFTMTMGTDLNDNNNKRVSAGISAEVCLNTTRSSQRASDDIVLMLWDIVLVLWQHIYALCGRLAPLPLGQRVVSLEHGFSVETLSLLTLDWLLLSEASNGAAQTLLPRA